MRIRGIKPEFWASEDIAALDWETRLIFIGLWSYVDDNGVGRDIEKLIVADLFPLEDDPLDTLAKVSRALRMLSERGQVTRYMVGGKPYLYITNWKLHQKIDHPNKPRYPEPTCEDATPRPPDGELSRESREGLAPGTGEQRNRGTEKSTPSPEPAALVLVTADAATARASKPSRPGFEDFWTHYPRKVGKDDARRAWDRAVKAKKIDPAVVIEGAQRLRKDPNLPSKQFIPHPSTWIARGGWDDEPYPAPGNGSRFTGTDVPEGW